MKHQFCKYLTIALFVVCSATAPGADDTPSPAWKINLAKLGYRPYAYFAQKTTVRFWRQYIVIEAAGGSCLRYDKASRKEKIITDVKPPAIRVVDIAAQQVVSKDVIAVVQW